MTNYRERLHAPLSWWLLGAVLAVTLGWVFLVVTTWTIAGVATGLFAAAIGWGLWAYGSLTLEVRDGDLIIGAAKLEQRFQGPAEPLDEASYRHTFGPGANARAFIRTRPYVRTGALIGVADDHDSTPYWLVSTRHPEALVASLAQSGKDQPTA